MESIAYQNNQVDPFRYYITLHPDTFPTKESFNLAFITHWFKRKGLSKRYTLEEIFEFCANGRAFIPSHIETDGEEYSFISSQLLVIDVDDKSKVLEPEQALELLRDVCAGLFFTSSHGIEGNRYRLVFILDKAIKDEQIYKSISIEVTKRLNSMGIPADTQIIGAMQRIRTGTKGYIISDLQARLSIDEYLEIARQEQKKVLQEKAKKMMDYVDRKVAFEYSFEELKERAKVIGYVEGYKNWERLAYSLKSYVQEGFIDDSEGYEIFSILCGGNDETTYWENLRNPNRISIGTFIGTSNEAGFKRTFKYYHAVSSKSFQNQNIEVRRFEKYISTDFAKEVLTAEQSVLIKSPTGSGKTTNFVNGAKELTTENISRYYLFSVPTQALVDQIAATEKILGVRGLLDSIFKKIQAYHNAGNRVIVVTYDMAAATVDMIRRINPFASFSLIIDEYHNLVYGFNYRRQAIEELYKLRYIVKSFVGLSGTPDDVLKTDFDKEIHIETKYSKAPCAVWGAITYRSKNDEEQSLIQLLKQKADHGKKLLVFIQNKDMITRIQKILSKLGIKARTITSDSKKHNPAYKTIVEHSRFPEDVQVLLTTSVLSDGISILNENIEYECIAVCSMQSPNFNVAMIRQMSNRFRNPYRAFYLFMQVAIKKTEYTFNIDQAHEYEKKLAQNAVDLLNEQFSGQGNTKLFSSARIEKQFGIQFDENECASYHELRLRHNVALEKSRYYSGFRNQFITALESLMEMKAKESIDISKHIEQESIDLTPFEEEVLRLKAIDKEDKNELAEAIATNFTEIVYQSFQDDNEDVLKVFKEVSTIEHYSCLKRLSQVASYELCLKIVKQVKRRADIHSFIQRIEALTHILIFSKVNRTTPTKEVFLEIQKYMGQFLSKKDLDEIAKKVGKKYKRSKKVDADYIIKNYFYHEKVRSQKERFTILHILTSNHVKVEFSVTDLDIQETMNNLLKTSDIENGDLLLKIIHQLD
jgi:Type III restriction enzyme, res subunit/Helicase conserved C-terminal domain